MEFWRRFFRQLVMPAYFAADGEGGGVDGGAGGGGEDGGGGGEDGGADGEGVGGGELKVRSFSQAEVDALLAQRGAEFANVDVKEYRALKEAKARQEREVLEKKGDFDKILAQTMKEKDEVIGRKDGEIAELGEQLTRIRVDNTLLDAASSARAINPQQIVTLLKGNVHYDRKSDSVEVRENGVPVYKSGKPLTVAQYVVDFLGANPHFMPAGPSGSGALGGGVGAPAGSVYKISVAEAKDPAKYRAAREAALKAGQSLSIER